MDTLQLKYFVEVVDSGSISKAATNLYVSQPNLSRVMHAMEEEMGRPLLIRGNRGIQTTKIGQQLYYYAQSLLNQFHLLEQLKNIGNEPSYRKLTISVYNIFLRDDIMLQYYKEAGANQSEIQLIETTAENVVTQVASLQAEIGILILNSYQLSVFRKMMDIKGLNIQELAHGPLKIHVHEKHPLAMQDTVRSELLLEYPYLHLPDDFYSNLNLPLNVSGVGVKSFKKEIIMNNYHSLLNMLNHTESFILGHIWHAEELSKSHVKTLDIENNNIEKHLLVLSRKKQELSEEAELFLKIFKDDYKEL